MIEWVIRNWGFCLGVAGVIAGGFKAFYAIDKKLTVLENNLTNALTLIKKDIKRLEEKQDKYNTLQERTLRNEMEIKHLKDRK